jgi:hypothetical protein
MNDATENSIRQEQAESFGRLMAGFSHDMKNHLGIIRESNGLMSDLVEMGGLAENEMLVERFKKSISSIERRIVIAAEMLHHLSSFAHRSDTPCSSFQINDLITEEHTFLERFSRLQQINVTLELGEGIASIYNDPSLLQHVFYRMYILCLEQLSPTQNLLIVTRQKEKIVEIIFRLPDSLQPTPEVFSYNTIQAAINKLQGAVQTGVDSKSQADISLAIPSLPIPSLQYNNT